MSNLNLGINHPSQTCASELETFDYDNINWESLNQLTDDLLPIQLPCASYVTSTIWKDHDLNYPEVDQHNNVHDWLMGLSAKDHVSPPSYQQMTEKECGQSAENRGNEFLAGDPSVSVIKSSDSIVSTDMLSLTYTGTSSPAIDMMHYSTVFDCDEISQSSSIASYSSDKSSSGSGQRFWQYNRHSKGPKAKKFTLKVSIKSEIDKAMKFTDPVFDRAVSDVSIPHVGKARKGTGTVVTPNPSQLYEFGKELDSLQASVKGLCSDKKEKNRLISKACRMKKNAHHEANKVKYYLLKQELGELQQLLVRMEQARKMAGTGPLTPLLNSLKSSLYKTRVAGNLDQTVDQVIDNVAQGDPTGGIDNLKTSDPKNHNLKDNPMDF